MLLLLSICACLHYTCAAILIFKDFCPFLFNFLSLFFYFSITALAFLLSCTQTHTHTRTSIRTIYMCLVLLIFYSFCTKMFGPRLSSSLDSPFLPDMCARACVCVCVGLLLLLLYSRLLMDFYILCISAIESSGCAYINR